MKPHEIAQLANHALEHGLVVTTKEDRLKARMALEIVLDAEIQGVIRMTRKELERVQGLYQLIKNNL